MSFPISPGINVREIDLTQSVAEQVSSIGGFAGKFGWGPIDEVALVSDETDLVQRFGKPTSENRTDFLTIASYLAYGAAAQIVRVDPGENTFNAGFPAKVGAERRLVKNASTYDVSQLSGYQYIAKYAGSRGNSIAIAECTSAAAFKLRLDTIDDSTFNLDFGGAAPVRSRYIPYNGAAPASSYFNAGKYGDSLIVDNVKYIVTAIDVPNNRLVLDRTYVGKGIPTTVYRTWKFAEVFGTAPKTGAMHIAVLDINGQFSDSRGAVLETFAGVSISLSAVGADGRSVSWASIVNAQSRYIYAGGTQPLVTSNPTVNQFSAGAYAAAGAVTDSYIAAYSHFANRAKTDVSFIIAGEAIKTADYVLANYIIESVAEYTKDCLAFVSPAYTSVVNNKDHEVTSCTADRESLTNSSYATMDSGWKYMYDKYNGVFAWVPLNGDHAGLYARCDREREVWVSAAGSVKGKILNVVKLAWVPDQARRDALYVNDINPVTIIPVAGVVMLGDKTLLGDVSKTILGDASSSFSRINVRRLFMTVEKAISNAAASLLFEFNDEFTQRRFVSIVEPFLRDVRGRRGITDFKVVADSSVNTPQVVQNNRFVGQVYIKPNYSINFIRLDFVAVGATASFDEVIDEVSA